MNYADMTVAQLNAVLDGLSEDRASLKRRALEITAIRNQKLKDERLDLWGLTDEQYKAAKAKAQAEKRPVHACLNEARRQVNREARLAQTATAVPVAIGIKAKGT